MEGAHPPKLMIRFLRWYCRPDLVDEIEGDLLEEFYDRVSRKGIRFARLHFFVDVLLFLRPFTLKRKTANNSNVMIYNYMLIAWRSFLKNRAYSILNVVGLTIGVLCAIIITLYVQDELTYDHHHTKLNNIYRLNSTYHLPNNGGREDYAVSGPVVGDMLLKDFPEILQVVRLRKRDNTILERTETGTRFYESIVYADSNIFNLLTFPFISGSSDDALKDLNTIVVSRQAAMKFFNTVDVVGKTIRLQRDTIDLMITGVFENTPSNTQFRFDYITSMETFRINFGPGQFNWWNYEFYTYLELNLHTDYKALTEKIKFISRNYIANQEDKSGYRQEYSLIPLSQVHLNSNLRGEIEPNGNATYVYMFMVIAVFILVIASTNFMNLATANSAMRAKEIGLRKVVGAVRFQLIQQFLGEAFILTFISVFFAVGLSMLALPFMNDYFNKDIDLIFNSNFWIILSGIIVFVALLSGSYPSLFLSTLKPTDTFKSNFRSPTGGKFLRRGLVVFQFSISTFLIAGTVIVLHQLNFLRSVNLGFSQDHTIFVPVRHRPEANEVVALREQLKRLSGVEDVTLSSNVPGKQLDNSVMKIGWDDDAAYNDMRYITCDESFARLYDVKLLAGRFFNVDFTADESSSFLINESGMKRLGWETPDQALGQKLTWQGRKGQVIGVLKDFHFMSANLPVDPFLVTMNTSWSCRYLSLKLSAGDPAGVIDKIKKTFTNQFPGQIFEYEFLDKDFDRQYKSEDQFMIIVTAFAGVAIVIACLGLYGLTMFIGQVRLKEICIRKIHGANSSNLALLMAKDFLILLIISFFIAVPVSYFVMKEWLSSFPLRDEISPSILLASIAITAMIALFTISFQVRKAIRSNPANSLR